LRQRIEGALEVEDELVRIELMAPLLLRLLAGRIAGRIRQAGARLLENPARKG
jgi:hypothetical protein